VKILIGGCARRTSVLMVRMLIGAWTTFAEAVANWNNSTNVTMALVDESFNWREISSEINPKNNLHVYNFL
jgi:hypothetical protein